MPLNYAEGAEDGANGGGRFGILRMAAVVATEDDRRVGIFEVGSFFLSATESRWFRWVTAGGNEPPNAAISSVISAV